MKTKGQYYKSICLEMENLDEDLKDAGCRFYGIAASTLNYTITFVNDNKLTKKQYVMFLLADMMTQVEVGASIARKALALTKANDSSAEKITVMSRIFACETAQLVALNTLKILMGSGLLEESRSADFLKTISYNKLIFSSRNIINDMDRIADILFER